MVSKLYTYVSSNRSKRQGNKWPFSYFDKNFIVPSAHLITSITPISKAPKEKRWEGALREGNHLILAMSCGIWGIDQVFFKRVYIFTI